MPGNIVLIGFMGSGKSTIGQILAKELGWRYLDTDAMIEQKVGISIKEIFAKYGEKYFRDLEEKAVSRTLVVSRTVIATGGGAVLSKLNVKNLKPGNKVVWLKVRPETVVDRVGADDGRPLLKNQDLSNITKLIEKRQSYYSFADLHIDTDQKDAAAVAGEIKEALEPWLENLK
ncbi:MAG: shikimate kinase [Clostridia bacterium]|nr:shikimate kinase [Clostridia bacterium]